MTRGTFQWIRKRSETRKTMETATRNDSDIDALLSELGVLYPVMTFTGPVDDPSPTDAWEAPSAFSTPQGDEERRSEMDARILAGLLRA